MGSPWTKTTPDTFVQERNGLEDFFHSLHTRTGVSELFIVSTRVHFKPPAGLSQTELQHQLKSAWVSSRARAPQITATNNKEGKVVKFLRGKSLEEWASKTFIVCVDKTADEVYGESLCQESGILFYFPKSTELMLQISHEFIDGRGCCYFWDIFFTNLINSETSENQTTPEMMEASLPPSMYHALGIPKVPTVVGQQAVPEILGRTVTENPVQMPPLGFSGPPRGSVRRVKKMSTENTLAVISCCKQKGITVTAAVQVAVGLALRKLQFEKNGKSGDTWPGFANFDARRFFNSDCPNANRAVANHFVVIPYSIKIGQDTFQESTSELSYYFKQGPKHPMADKLWEAFNAILAPVLAAVRNTSQPNPTPWFTSMGVIGDFMGSEYGRWQIEDFDIQNSITAAFPVISLWTWKGQLVTTVAYNEAYYEETVALELLESAERILLSSLDIDATASNGF